MAYIIQTKSSRLLFVFFLLSPGFLFQALVQADDVIKTDKQLSLNVRNGDITLQLSTQQSALGRFKIQTLKTASYQPEHSVSGKVLSIQPLLELQNKLRTVAISLFATQQREKIASSVLRRAQKLVAQGITSAAKTEKYNQNWLTLQTSMQAYQTQQNYLQASAEQQWGHKLAEAMTKPDPQLTKLLSGNSALLLITVPISDNPVDSSKSIVVSIDGQRAHAVPAEFLSASPVSDQIVGNSYFYIAHTNQLQTGARVMAWIPMKTQNYEGVLIPESAIIWHNARPWVYLRMNDQLYVRRVIGQYRKTKGQWFVTENFTAGDCIVIAGSAALLSEELRSQIPEEDDD
jgi:hypothetical protein